MSIKDTLEKVNSTLTNLIRNLDNKLAEHGLSFQFRSLSDLPDVFYSFLWKGLKDTEYLFDFESCDYQDNSINHYYNGFINLQDYNGSVYYDEELWDLSQLKVASGLFYNNTNLKKFSLASFNLNNALVMGVGDYVLEETEIGTNGTNPVKYKVILIGDRGMFENCTLLTHIPDLINCKPIICTSMCYNCYSLEDMPVMDLSKVQYSNRMFQNCNFMEIDGNSTISLPEVVNIDNMFNSCKSIEGIKIDAPKCTSYTGVLNTCSKLVSAELNLGVVTNLRGYIAQGCTELEHFILAPNTIASTYLRLQQHTKLDAESIQSMIDALVPVSEGNTKVYRILFASTVQNTLSQEQLDAITAKGWLYE